MALGRDRFDSDRAIALAVERLLEIIGEAANALDDATREQFPDVPWRDLTRLRIVLAHHYHRIDADQVWTIATDEVPRLAIAQEPPCSGAISDSGSVDTGRRSGDEGPEPRTYR